MSQVFLSEHGYTVFRPHFFDLLLYFMTLCIDLSPGLRYPLRYPHSSDSDQSTPKPLIFLREYGYKVFPPQLLDLLLYFIALCYDLSPGLLYTLRYPLSLDSEQ